MEEREFTWDRDIDGAHVELRSAFNPCAQEKETRIRVTSLSTGLILIDTFSHKAVRKRHQWRLLCLTGRRGPGSA